MGFRRGMLLSCRVSISCVCPEHACLSYVRAQLRARQHDLESSLPCARGLLPNTRHGIMRAVMSTFACVRSHWLQAVSWKAQAQLAIAMTGLWKLTDAEIQSLQNDVLIGEGLYQL
eukprot:6072172-Amphidinium_carterae.1